MLVAVATNIIGYTVSHLHYDNQGVSQIPFFLLVQFHRPRICRDSASFIVT